MSKAWYPVINYETCIECGKCIRMCRHGVYDKTSTPPKVIYPEGCIEGCHGCGNRCPTHSIEYVGDTIHENKSGCGDNCSCNCKGE